MKNHRANVSGMCVIVFAAALAVIPARAQQTAPQTTPANPPAATDKPAESNSNQRSGVQQASAQQNAASSNGAQSAVASSANSAATDAAHAPNASSTAAAPNGAPAASASALPVAPAGKIVLPTGTHLPLVLHNAVTTRSAKPGDPVYLETLFPIMADGHVVIPAGSYVSGEVTEAKRPGRVKGRGEIMIKLNTLIMPNGYMVNFNATPGGGAGTGGNETMDDEGKIKGDSDKTGDIGTVATTTAAGAGIGGLATRTPAGAGIGAGIGAAAGLLAVLLTRGPEAELPRGTTLEAVLNRPLYLEADKVQFTSPGQASTLAGPPNREPVRTRENPF